MTSRIGEIEAAASAYQIASQLKRAGEAGKKIVPLCPTRLKQWRGSLQSDVVLLNLDQHAQILEHWPEDQVIMVESGISLQALDQHLERSDQWLPLSFGATSLSLLETLVTGDGGALSHHGGGPRRLCLGLTMAMSNGALIRTGGKVVKNVTGYDLTKLVIGSYGTLALPVTAYLRLEARPKHLISFSLTDNDPLKLLEQGRLIERSGLPLVAVELVDKRLLTEISSAGSGINERCRFVLLVRFAIHDNALENEVRKLGDVWLKQGFPLAWVENESKLWSTLFDTVVAADCAPIDATLSRQAFFSLWRENNCFDDPFMYGAGTGLAKFFNDDAAKQGRLIDNLDRYAKKSAMAMTISYADEQYTRRVKRLGKDVSLEAQLFASLKETFDPLNCMNPFVCFQ